MPDKMRSSITDIHLFGSNVTDLARVKTMYDEGILHKGELSAKYPLTKKIEGIMEGIESRLKARMSQMSLGIYQALQHGGAKNLKESDELYLFTAFSEIDTTDKIIKDLMLNESTLVSPTLFHNSVHNTPLGYFMIIKKYHNYCTTISDGLATGKSFAEFANYKTLLGDEYIIAAGDEYSEFFELDTTVQRALYPVFISYRVEPSDKGFALRGSAESFAELVPQLGAFAHVVVPGSLLGECSRAVSADVFTEYPLTGDFPVAIAVRLAMPFILGLSGKSAVVEYARGRYYLFEVDAI